MTVGVVNETIFNVRHCTGSPLASAQQYNIPEVELKINAAGGLSNGRITTTT